MDDQKLIECVRAHECLYDQSTKEYRKTSARLSAWKQVAEQMGSTATECKKHWNNLRNAYLHAVSRRRKPGNSISKWRYADEMSFLLPFFIPKAQPNTSKDCNMDDSSNLEFDEDSEGTDEGSIVIKNEEVLNSDPIESNNDVAQNVLVEVIKHMQPPEKDGIDLFFASMAATVKQLPRHEQVRLKAKIFQIVHDAEVRCLVRRQRNDGTHTE